MVCKNTVDMIITCDSTLVDVKLAFFFPTFQPNVDGMNKGKADQDQQANISLKDTKKIIIRHQT